MSQTEMLREHPSSLFERAKGRMKRGLGREKTKQELEEAELRVMRESATEQESVALALAAFAVQAYLKSVLCPSLSDFTPRASLPQTKVNPQHALSPITGFDKTVI